MNHNIVPVTSDNVSQIPLTQPLTIPPSCPHLITRVKVNKTNSNQIRIYEISDLHLELYDYENHDADNIMILENLKISPSMDKNSYYNILILAGDIGNPRSNEYTSYIKRMAELFDLVLLVSGNHEYFNKSCVHNSDILTIGQIDKMIDEICSIMPKHNVHYLNRRCVDLGEWTFIGTTLWSNAKDFNESKSTPLPMFDFKAIYTDDRLLLTQKKYVELHDGDLKWIEQALEDTKHMKQNNIVVVTHHLPSWKVCHPTYTIRTDWNGTNFNFDGYETPKRKNANDMNVFFATQLNDLIESNPSIKYWFAGHSHHKIITKIGTTTIVVNTSGSPEERRADLTIDKPVDPVIVILT